MPTLKELADNFCDDNDFQYVLTTSKVASLPKINTENPTSIFTKLKAYPYEFEINSSLQLASINGVKIADNNNLNSEILGESSIIEDFKIKAYASTKVITVDLENDMSNIDNIIGYIIFVGSDAIDISKTLPYQIKNLNDDTAYNNIYVIAIDNKGKVRKSSNSLNVNTNKFMYAKDGITNYYDGIENTYLGHNNSATQWEDLIGNKNLDLMNFNNNEQSGWSNNGLMFDGNGDGLYLGNKYKDLFKSSSTIEIVIKFNNTDRRATIIGNYDNSHNINIEQYYKNTRFYWNSGSPDVSSSFNELTSDDTMTLTYVIDKQNNQIIGYKNANTAFTLNDSRFGSYDFDWVDAWIRS